MLPELPQTYYLDNVITLFDHVERVYGDILDSTQLAFLETFSELSSDAQKLYIRLLNRSHDVYRLSKLSYPEITSMQDALHELESNRCVRLNPPLRIQCGSNFHFALNLK